MTPATRVLCAAAGVIGLVLWVVGMTRDWWAVPIPDAAHSYRVTFRGGAELYFMPALGWFLDYALWIVFALFLTAVVVELLMGRRSRSAASKTDRDA
jgi:hypothetical protein